MTRAFFNPFTAVRHIAAETLELICPSRCAACGRSPKDSGQLLCGTCWESIREGIGQIYCRTCGHTAGGFSLIDDRCHLCQGRRLHVSRLVRTGPYDETLRTLIHALKYHRQDRLDVLLGQMLAAAILGDSRMADIDALIPIPLHWRRRWVRQYNQAELLARACARELRKNETKVPVRCDLVRVRATEPQFSLPVSSREANLRGAFAARPDAPLAGRHICLIDDITTTGATLHVAARTLKKAGAARVTAAVLAAAGNL